MPYLSLLLDEAVTLLRWLHVVAAFVWVGSAFALARLDLGMSRAPGDNGSLLLHAGQGFRFSRAERAGAQEPALNFKWEAYAAWASGFLLLCLIYLPAPRLYLIDAGLWEAPGWAADALALALLPLVWLAYDVLCRKSGLEGDRLLAALFLFSSALALLLSAMFSGRAAWLLLGADLATIMAANIAHAIVPAQRRRLAALIDNRAGDADDLRMAATRALHNQYLALPVVFFMLSGHAPLLFAGPHNGIAAVLFLGAGFLIRRFFLIRARGLGSDWRLAGAAAALILAALLIEAPRAPRSDAAAHSAHEAIALALHPGPDEALKVVERHCATCHAAAPVMPGVAAAPAGLDFSDIGNVEKYRAAILRASVFSRAMPPPGMGDALADDEKMVLLRWAEVER